MLERSNTSCLSGGNVAPKIPWSNESHMKTDTGTISSRPGTRIEPQAPHLEYHGGKVIAHMKVISVYLGGYWSTAEGISDRRYLDTFGKKLLVSRYTSVWREYGAGPGTFVGSVAVPTVRYPKRVTDAMVQRVVSQMRATSNLPAAEDTVYTVYLPPGSVLIAADGTPSTRGMGGYHGSYFDDAGKRVYYAAIVYSEPGNGVSVNGSSRDAITVTASHEWSEAATDPDVNNGQLGWYDHRYGEIGDIPVMMGIPLRDLVGRIGGFAVQKEWSNRDGVAEVSVHRRGKEVMSPPIATPARSTMAVDGTS